jgi:hypothetical protein
MLRVLFHVLAFSFLPQRARAALRALSVRSAGLNFWLVATPPLRPSFTAAGSFLTMFTIYAQPRGAPQCIIIVKAVQKGPLISGR